MAAIAAARSAFQAQSRRNTLIQRTKSLTTRDLDPDNAKRKNLLDLLREGTGTAYLTELVEASEQGWICCCPFL